MRPEARVAAAIEILDGVLADQAAEAALIRWSRANRFAGSGDRAAVRDLVFSALRCRGSCLALSGQADLTGRALMIGHAVASGARPDVIFTGEGYAPAPLSGDERAALASVTRLTEAELVRLDVPGWLLPALEEALGPRAGDSLAAMRCRAPVYLRVNAGRSNPSSALKALSAEGIVARPVEAEPLALEVTGNAGRIRTSAAYLGGLVEVQDLSPQSAIAGLPLAGVRDALDYCAGGGGKALALAARGVGRIVAHDIAPGRMADLPDRAARAGARIAVADGQALRGQVFDLVLLDVPCSGSGTWRRDPDAKWRLTPARLETLLATQAAILDAAPQYVRAGGAIAYMTCSLLEAENGARVARFLAAHPAWTLTSERRFTPDTGGDGLYVAHLTRG
ncbi:MAG: RsmB/NOP family class I SAM-dependent RNA methyltransferase [Rhodobacteraceae bacterium]|nr:RsmB/NOP family class I SAM-dependent RNA methyltransferase [Paracoccaceae bacterium]